MTYPWGNWLSFYIAFLLKKENRKISRIIVIFKLQGLPLHPFFLVFLQHSFQFLFLESWSFLTMNLLSLSSRLYMQPAIIYFNSSIEHPWDERRSGCTVAPSAVLPSPSRPLGLIPTINISLPHWLPTFPMGASIYIYIHILISLIHNIYICIWCKRAC